MDDASFYFSNLYLDSLLSVEIDLGRCFSFLQFETVVHGENIARIGFLITEGLKTSMQRFGASFHESIVVLFSLSLNDPQGDQKITCRVWSLP